MAEPALVTPPQGLAYRLRIATTPSNLSILMLHGWGGDEKVMWVLQSALPGEAHVASPRGLFAVDDGYTWVRPPETGVSDLASFNEAVGALEALVPRLGGSDPLRSRRLLLMGFSQGAALAFAYAARSELPLLGIASLAGFVPEGDLMGLGELPVFWAHGTTDERVPIERARRDAERLVAAGVRLTFCEDPVGHRVGVNCMRDLKAWIAACTQAEETGEGRQTLG